MAILRQIQLKIKDNDRKRGLGMEKKQLPVARATEESVARKIQKEREEDFKLQATIQRLLRNNGYMNNVTSCLKAPIGMPYLARSKKSERVSYGNISTCSNVWLCPVCGKKIGKKRALEIVKLVSWAYMNNYTVCMLTFTHCHSKDDPLKKLKEKHAKALRKFKSGEVFNLMKNKMGYIGSVTGNEVTYGINGWHWHTHCLFIVKSDEWIRENENKLKNRWYSCLKSVGMKGKKKDILDHGLDMEYEMHDTEYLIKFGCGNWGADREITGGAKKKGHGKNPWELAKGNRKEKELFLEYAKAVSLGNKTFQLRWSKGLKEEVGITDKTDKQVNEEKEDNTLLGYLSIKDWKIILRYDARSRILDIAESEGFIGVCRWLESHYFKENSA